MRFVKYDQTEYTLTSKHYGVMLVIHSNPNVSQKEIGEILRIDRTTMVALIDYLEDIGFAKRIKNPSDRRTYYLSLTDKGNDAWQTLNLPITPLV